MVERLADRIRGSASRYFFVSTTPAGRDDTLPTTTAPNRLNTVVNVAILATILALLVSPTGPLSRWYVERRERSETRENVLALWDEMVAAADIISERSEAENTVVVFTDYECPFCRSSEPSLRTAVANGIQFAVIQLPLTQIHSHAEAAAKAALCTPASHFPVLHAELMKTTDWMDEGMDWRTLVEAHGGVGSCVASDDTQQLLDTHLSFAARLRIASTPAFVSASGTIGLGADGLRIILEEAGVAMDRSLIRYELGDVLFDSSEFPDAAVSEAGRISSGLMLGNDRIVLTDPMTGSVLFIDTSGGHLTRAGRRGRGPGEFQTLRGLQRTSTGGVFVDDWGQSRITVFDRDGSLVATMPYEPQAFRGLLRVPQPIAVDVVERVAVFRDGDPMFNVRPDGPWRGRVDYVVLSPDGSQTPIAEAQGKQLVRRNQGGVQADYEKPFFYSVLDATVGSQLLVMDTESGTLRVYNRTGRELASFNVGSGVVPVTQEMDSMWRSAYLERQDRRGSSGSGDGDGAPAGAQALLSGFLAGRGAGAEEFYRNAEGNAVTPAAERMFVDGNGRLWVQEYALPNADAAAWLVWSLEDREAVGALEVPIDYTVLDALNDRILLRGTGDFDVVFAVVRQLRVQP